MDPADTIRQAWTQRDMANAQDQAAVLASRISDNTDRHLATVPADQERSAPAVPAWIADRRSIDSEHTAPEWREHLAERYDYLLHTRLEERGATIAAEQPVWARELGEVPADTDRRQRWTELAAEVDVFRTQYRIDPKETAAVPADYRQRPRWCRPGRAGHGHAQIAGSQHTSRRHRGRPPTRRCSRRGSRAARA